MTSKAHALGNVLHYYWELNLPLTLMVPRKWCLLMKATSDLNT